MPDLWLQSPDWRVLLMVDENDEGNIFVQAPKLDMLEEFIGKAPLERVEVKPPNRSQPNFRANIPREIVEASIMRYVDTIRPNPMQWFDMNDALGRRDL